MHLGIKNQVLASRKNMISSAISILLTYTGIFRQNAIIGHGFDLFHILLFFFIYIY